MNITILSNAELCVMIEALEFVKESVMNDYQVVFKGFQNIEPAPDQIPLAKEQVGQYVDMLTGELMRLAGNTSLIVIED